MKVKGQGSLLLNGQWWTYLSIGTPGLGTTVEMIGPLSLSWPWNYPLKVNRGQRSRCSFINWTMVNLFVYRHPGPRSSRCEDLRQFHFRDLEMIRSRSSKVKFFCGFWKAHIDFPIVFHSNMRLSHKVKKISAIFTFVTLKWPLKVNQGQRSKCIFISWAMMNIFVYRHPGP